jgi:hypothetical protein
MSGWQTGGDDFDIQEFEAQEDRIIELACYVLAREKDRIRACYELGRKSHRNADFTISLVPSRSLFPAFLSRF